MSVERSLIIRGAGPTGTTIVTLDENGIYDNVGGRYHSALMDLTMQLLAASVDTFMWTCREGVWQMVYATSVITVTGGASATVMPVHCAQSVAIASGTAQLTAALDLQETAPNKQQGTLIATPTQFFPGDSLGLDFSGTLTGLVGMLTISMERVA